MAKVIWFGGGATVEACPLTHLGYLWAACAAGSQLWVSGYQGSGGGYLPLLFRYASGWTDHSSLISPPPDAWPYALAALDSTHVWAACDTGSNIDTRDQVWFWDGSTWTLSDDVDQGGAAGYSTGGAALAVVAAEDVWLLGRYQYYDNPYYLRHWNGTAWAWVAIPDSSAALLNYMAGLVSDGAGTVWAIGNVAYYSSFDRAYQQLAAPVTGGGSPYIGDYGEFVRAWADSTHVYACGYIQTGPYTSSPETLPDVKRYDGSIWTTLGVLPELPAGYQSSASLYGISGTSSNDLWAAGFVWNSAYTAAAALLYHWDGTAWTDYSPTTYNGPAQYAYLQDVVAVSSTDVLAVGSVTCVDGTQHVYALHWDGTAWTERAIPA